MIFDQTNKFSSEQAVTATAVSTNVIDLGVAGRDVGAGEPVRVDVEVGAAFAGLTSLAVEIQSASSEDFATGLRTLITSRATPVGELTAGYKFPPIHLPKGIEGRYLRLNYVVVGTGTAGTMTSGIVAGHQHND